ncbi:MAG: phosphatase domain-containing protein [Candidatus Brocadiia bacterium]
MANLAPRRTGLYVLLAVLLAQWDPAPAAADDEGYVSVDAAYGTARTLVVTGRAFEEPPLPAPEDEGSRLGNLVRSARLLDTDEYEDRPVTITVANRTFETLTNRDGVYRIRVDCGKQAFPPGRTEVRVRVEIESGHSVVTSGTAYIYPADVSRVVVSDFDDTLCHTGATEGAEVVWRVLTWDPERMEPVQGMKDFLSALSKAREGAPQFPVFYLSAGPVNFQPRVEEFLERNGFPPGTLLLRNFGIGGDADPFSSEKYKTQHLTPLFGMYPEARFVLIGDSGEKDPKVYAGLRADYSDRVPAIFIRRVGGAERPEDEARLSDMVVFRDAAEAVKAALAKGLLAKPNEEGESNEDEERADGDGPAR